MIPQTDQQAYIRQRQLTKLSAELRDLHGIVLAQERTIERQKRQIAQLRYHLPHIRLEDD